MLKKLFKVRPSSAHKARFEIEGIQDAFHQGFNDIYPDGTPMKIITLRVEPEKGYSFRLVQTLRLHELDLRKNQAFLKSVGKEADTEKEVKRLFQKPLDLIGLEGNCEIKPLFKGTWYISRYLDKQG